MIGVCFPIISVTSIIVVLIQNQSQNQLMTMTHTMGQLLKSKYLATNNKNRTDLTQPYNDRGLFLAILILCISFNYWPAPTMHVMQRTSGGPHAVRAPEVPRYRCIL